MSIIRIKNFGPIKEGHQENDGWLSIKKVTVFIGNQGSGKSTLAKIISTMTWLEKAIIRGDIDKGKISLVKFREFFEYQRIRNYFKDDTEIEYIGSRLTLKYNKSLNPPEVKIVEKERYDVPKIMYVPAERNFLSAISNAYNIKGLPDNIFAFGEELKKAQKELNGKKLRLPFRGYTYEYNESEDTSFIAGPGYRINLLEASSGLQSFVPLFLVSRNLSMSISDEEETLRENLSVTQSIRMNEEIAKLMLNSTIPDNNKNEEIDKIRAKYYNKCFINIVEEPEQNLFPTSQWDMLKRLLRFNNLVKGNKLILTTHSPYIVNYLTLAVKANTLKEKIKNEELKDKLQEIVPLNSTINPKDLIIYELDELNGVIKKLETYNDLPSDENKLNERLGESNEYFAKLLEIQQEL